MADNELILAIDNGTQSVKAMLFDRSGQLAAIEKVPFDPPYLSEQPGWAEQSPDYFYASLVRACRGLFAKAGANRDRICGVALTAQRGTVINLDDEGRPLRPAILWLDQRRAEGVRPLGGRWGLLFRLAGLSDTIAYFQGQAEANWIRARQPELWAKTRKYLLLSGYLSYRLTGAFVDSVGCQVGYIPFDYKRLAWAGKGDWKWQAVAVERSMCPELIPPGGLLGRITEEASAATGIPAGLPLLAAAADKACEVIGSGSLDPSIGCLSYGTTATINVTHDRYVEAVPLLPAYPSCVPNHYSLEVQVYRGFWMVSWFKEQFGALEQREASEKGGDAEALFDRLLDRTPAGAMGLMLQPYWSPGVKSPGPEAKGAILGFGDVHTRADIYRAIIEGIGYALREGKERIEKKTKAPIGRLRVSGGGSRSPKVMQLTADLFGLPASTPHVYEASGLGAAMTAAVGLGLHPDFSAAVAAMTRVGREYAPDMERFATYDALYRRVYRQMYKALRPFYEEIRDITGYPP